MMIGAARSCPEKMEISPEITTSPNRTSSMMMRICPLDAWRLLKLISPIREG